jgi:hypothetical protein
MEVKDNLTLLTGEKGKIMAIIPLSKSRMEAGRHGTNQTDSAIGFI